MKSYKTNTTVNDRLDNSGHACPLRGVAIAILHVALMFALLSVLLATVTGTARAQTLTTLYTFTGGADGGYPGGTLASDGRGNLYGTSAAGGAYDAGTVFKLAPSGAETVLYSFTGGADGDEPENGVVRDSSGNLYGTTALPGYGTVFMLTKKGQETVLHTFTLGTDGGGPRGGLVVDKLGNLYGATAWGGICVNCGVLYEIPRGGSERVLYSFTGSVDGALPQDGPIRDSKGNPFLTTAQGGTYNWGTAFEMLADGSSISLCSFSGGIEGKMPEGRLVRDNKGNLYGTTIIDGAYGYGIVFKLNERGGETPLYSFQGLPDAQYPSVGLVRDKLGNLYGVTCCGGAYNHGAVFEVSASGTERVLYSFTGGADGANPLGGLLIDGQGNLIGTTWNGGSGCFGRGCGTVFKLTP